MIIVDILTFGLTHRDTFAMVYGSHLIFAAFLLAWFGTRRELCRD